MNKKGLLLINLFFTCFGMRLGPLKVSTNSKIPGVGSKYIKTKSSQEIERLEIQELISRGRPVVKPKYVPKLPSIQRRVETPPKTKRVMLLSLNRGNFLDMKKEIWRRSIRIDQCRFCNVDDLFNFISQADTAQSALYESFFKFLSKKHIALLEKGQFCLDPVRDISDKINLNNSNFVILFSYSLYRQKMKDHIERMVFKRFPNHLQL